MTDFSVQIQSFDDLSAKEQIGASDNGRGRKWANYLRVVHNGKTLFLENDAMETEDVSFHRDLKWVIKAIMKAYELGLADGRGRMW